MLADPSRKYPRADVLSLAERNWPANTLSQAPRWCSTDLRDGNQALVNPMNREQKMRLFERLVQCGFKEIEVAFPAASNTDFTFVRELIEQQHIPEDVWIQVITQSRPDLIERTLAALQGAPRAIVHLYNATAPLFRELVFRQDKAATIALAVRGVTQIHDHCDAHSNTDWVLEYSPETFCFTEPEFALAICTEVIETWQPSAARPLILNLPATVEVNTPNVYADQIEWFVRRLPVTEHVTISVHPHNDRGTGVACAELAMLAGATRVEGCLFGNGERTGNVDLVTLALNLYTQGISPELDFSGLRELVALVEECNGLPVHPRHPYAGELVFTDGLTLRVKINANGEQISLQGHGNGLLSAMMDAINHHYGLSLDIVDYHEHTLGQASRSKAVAYLECRHGGLSRHGVGIDTDSARAGLQAVINITGAALADQLPR